MKSLQSIRIRVQLIVGLLVAILVAGCALSAVHAFEQRQRAQRVMAITDVSRDLFAAMNSLRLERGGVDNGLVTPPPPTEADRRYRQGLRARALTSLEAASLKLRMLAPDGDRYGQAEISRRRAAVDTLREEANRAFEQPLARRAPDLERRWMTVDTGLIDTLDQTSARLQADIGQDDPFISTMMNIGQLAWSARDAAGTQILLTARAMAVGKPVSQQQLSELDVLGGRTDAPWSFLQRQVALHGAPPALRSAIARANDSFFIRARSMDHTILDALSAGRPVPVSVADERRIDTQGLMRLMDVASTAFDIAAAHAADEASAAQHKLYAAVTVMIVVVGLGLLASLFISASVLQPIGRITEAMRAVAEGDLGRPIPDTGRPDEVGELARALGVFRANALAKQQMDEELLKSRVAKEAAEAAARTQAEFLANMSHEIRTPLTGVIGFAGLMARLDDLPERAQTYTRRIITGGQALLSLVNDILDFSRIEAGQIELDPQPFDLEAFLTDTVDLIRPEAEKKGLALSLTLADTLPAKVQADAERVRQVLLNLIGNAIKFTDEGGVSVEADYDAARGGRLTIKVSDTGVGVSAEHGDRLFQRFSQVDGSNTRRHGGAGLGLAISKGLVELMGGEIGIEDPTDSRSSRGATFWFGFVAPAVETDPAPDLTDEPRARNALGALRILVVDDVAVNRELVGALLSPFDLDVSEATNGAEAVEAAGRDQFDLILMDLQMPVMDGLAATRAIRTGSSLNAATPILAVSANVMPPQVAACMAAGMNDHIAKPINPVEFLSKIGRWTAAAA